MNNIAIIGAGTMGHALAQVFAQGGYQVSLNDLSEEILQQARGLIDANLDTLCGAGLFDPAEKTALRESLSSLKRAHIILIEKKTGIGAKARLKKRFPQSEIFEYTVQNMGFFKLGKDERESRDKLEKKRILAFCGIARPNRFFSLLQEEGIRPARLLKFPDHHPYPASSVKNIVKEFHRANAEALFTTEKDAVKVRDAKELIRLPVYYLKIDLGLEQAFYLNISSFLERIKQ